MLSRVFTVNRGQLDEAIALVEVVEPPPPPGVLLPGAPGIDVSHWQGVIDWQAVAADGQQFAYLKATDPEFGAGKIDGKFEANRLGCRTAGVLWGAYHFFRPLYGALSQAEDFLRALAGDWGDLRPALDVEYGLPTEAQMRIWLERVESATGKRPIIYTRASFWNEIGNPPLGDYGLWVASYRENHPILPAGWQDYLIWQYTDRGSVAGIVPVDQNRWG